MVPDRDMVQTRRSGRPGPQVPLVQLEDPTYEPHPQLALLDDSDRHALAQVVQREREEAWRQGMLTSSDRRQARLWAAAVGTAALGGLLLSAADLLLHILK